jgi:pimeloyl-ACP methyl ester carboxylesterase
MPETPAPTHSHRAARDQDKLPRRNCSVAYARYLSHRPPDIALTGRFAGAYVYEDARMSTPTLSEAAPQRLVVETDLLAVAVEQWGPTTGDTVLLLHGFPYDPRAFDRVAPRLAEAGLRVLVPYLRGYGPTRFRAVETPRSGQQGALAHDVLALLDALGLASACLVGFDWGGRAAGVVAALWPERVRGLVAIGGYLIQDLADPARPAPPAIEHRVWHQYYLASERGRRALSEQPEALCRHFWQQWSPGWPFDEACFARTVASFRNPDFAAVVSHSYAHRIGAAAGDPRYAAIEQALQPPPPIGVPAIILRGGAAPLGGRGAERFQALRDDRELPGIGHNPALEAPAAVVRAVLDLCDG